MVSGVGWGRKEETRKKSKGGLLNGHSEAPPTPLHTAIVCSCYTLAQLKLNHARRAYSFGTMNHPANKLTRVLAHYTRKFLCRTLCI